MRVGIFFGGPSRERDVSFAGGRTALAHLDKSLFEPVLVFVSGWGRFYRVEPEFLTHGSIRAALPDGDGFSVYDESLDEDAFADAEPLEPDWFEDYFDIVFLAMHGPDCEDGALQGLLEWYKVPYTGPGLLGSAIGINKILQNHLIALVNGQQKKTATISRDAWESCDKAAYFASLTAHLGLPVVVKAPHQGSSIGVAIVRQDELDTFCAAVDQCFFVTRLSLGDWAAMDTETKHAYAQKTAEITETIGFPLVIEQTAEYITSPTELIETLDGLTSGEWAGKLLTLSAVNAEDDLLFEEFLVGQEFSCGVIQDDDGNAIALPPTEIYNAEAFDYATKYLTNVSKKAIPVRTSLENNRRIQLAVAEVFTKLGINVYSRIDGFLTADHNGGPHRVLIHDPNTIPGMSPSSLIFKQMAEIGMNLTDALTYLIRQSLRERIRTGKDTFRLKSLLRELDQQLADRKVNPRPEELIRFAPTDADWSDARQRYHRLAALGAVRPILMLQTADGEQLVPVWFLFKETITDLETALASPRHELLPETMELAKVVTERYLV
jgi:D-alanine-D-alanine ligase